MQRINAQKGIYMLRTLTLQCFLIGTMLTPCILLSCANPPHPQRNSSKKEQYCPPLHSEEEAKNPPHTLKGIQTEIPNPCITKPSIKTLYSLNLSAQAILEANDGTPSILEYSEGPSTLERDAELKPAHYRGRTQSDQKKEHKPTTSSCDVLQELWLGAAENPFFPREDRNTHTPESIIQPIKLSPEELATKKIISSSVALLMLQKNEIETLGARSFEQKRRLWYGRQELKNDLLVYFMSIERLYPGEETHQVPAYGYRDSSRQSLSGQTSSLPTTLTQLPTGTPPEPSKSVTVYRHASPALDKKSDTTSTVPTQKKKALLNSSAPAQPNL